MPSLGRPILSKSTALLDNYDIRVYITAEPSATTGGNRSLMTIGLLLSKHFGGFMLTMQLVWCSSWYNVETDPASP